MSAKLTLVIKRSIADLAEFDVYVFVYPLGWYRPSVGVPRDVGCRRCIYIRVANLFSVQFRRARQALAPWPGAWWAPGEV